MSLSGRSQASLAQSKEGLQREWERAQAAASERSKAMAALEEARTAARGVLVDLEGGARRFAAAFGGLVAPEGVPQLAVPSEYWVSAESRAPLGELLAAAGRVDVLMGEIGVCQRR